MKFIEYEEFDLSRLLYNLTYLDKLYQERVLDYHTVSRCINRDGFTHGSKQEPTLILYKQYQQDVNKVMENYINVLSLTFEPSKFSRYYMQNAVTNEVISFLKDLEYPADSRGQKLCNKLVQLMALN